MKHLDLPARGKTAQRQSGKIPFFASDELDDSSRRASDVIPSMEERVGMEESKDTDEDVIFQQVSFENNYSPTPDKAAGIGIGPNITKKWGCIPNRRA